MSLPLTGLRVLDCSRLLPGPFTSLVLADLGAEVIKIEDTEGGDYTRWSPPFIEGQSAGFLMLNRNKESVQLNFKKPEGVEAFKRMASAADVVLESFRPGVMDRLGVGYETLKAINPRLIYCAISGYGQTGPWRDRAGHDINYNATAGVLDPNGRWDGPPQLPAVQIADIGGGALYAVVGILTALYRRQTTGQGDMVDISMTDGSLSFNVINFAHYFASGENARRGAHALNGGFLCYGIYETKDGRHMACGALEPKFWIAFCKAVGREDLETLSFDPPTNTEERKKVEDLFKSKTHAEWIAFMAEKKLDACIEPILNSGEVYNHPLFAARGMFFEVPHPAPGSQPVRQIRTPVHMASLGELPKNPAPIQGAHTVKRLKEAGYSEAEIEAMIASGAVKTD